MPGPISRSDRMMWLEQLQADNIKKRRDRFKWLDHKLQAKLGNPRKIDDPDMPHHLWYWSMANAIVDGSEKRSSLPEPQTPKEKVIAAWLDLAMDLRL
jgi:hypothetical protein